MDSNSYIYTDTNTNTYAGGYQRPPTPEEWRLRQKRTVGAAASRIGFALCVMLLLSDFVPSLFIGILMQWFHISELAVTCIATAFLYLVAMPVFYAIVRGLPKREPIKRELSAGQWGVYFLMCMPLLYAGSYLGEGISRLLMWLTGLQVTDALNDTLTDMPLFMVLLLTVILAPIMEELVFRRAILDRLGMYGALPAAVFSGLVFGLYHGNFYQFFYAFFLGIVFSVIYLKTGRLRYTVLLHMAVNFLGAFIPSLLEMIKNESFYQLANYLNFLLMAGMVLAGFVLLIIQRRSFRMEAAPEELPVGEEYRFFCNAGAIFYYLFCAFCFILLLL